MWFDKGLQKIVDFYKRKDLMSIVLIVAQFDIPKKNIYLNSFNLGAMFLLIQSKVLISMFYKMLESFSKESSESKLAAWREDLNVNIPLDVWEEICIKDQLQAVNHFAREFKIF